MYFNASASGFKKIDNFYTNEILPFGPSNIGNQHNPFENGYFNNLILGNVSSNNVILSNLTTENLRFNFATGNNLIINNTINSNTISTGNLRFTNGTGNNLIINNTINSNTISAGNIFNTNQTANLLHINNRINISNTQQSISQIPVFIEANNDQNFLVVSAGGGGSFSTKRSGLILGRQRNDLTTFRIENNSNGNLEIYSGVGSSINLYHNTSGSNIFNINSSRLSTGNIVNTNTTLQNLRALNITTENIDITRGGVNLLTFNFATGSNLKMNNNIEAVSISATNGNINNLTTSNLITTNISSSNSTITNLISSNISTSNISSNNLQVSNSTINSLRFNNFNSPFRYATNGTFDLNIDDSLKIDDGKLEIGNIGTYLRGVKGIQTLNATLMLDQVNDLFGFTVFDDVEDFTEQLGVNVDAVFVNTFINEDHFKFGNGFPFSYIPPFPLELKLPSNNQIVFIRDNKLTGDNSLKFNQATQSCTIENLEGEHIDFRDASFTYITSGNIRSTNLLYGPNLYVNNLHSCANATMTNLKVNNVLTFDSIQGDLISTKNMLLVNITTSNIKANNKITSDVLDSSIISAGSILTNHITSSNLRINTTASINNLQCEVAFIGGMSVGNATMNNLRILQGMTCESIRANDTISSLCFSSANLFNQTATLGNIEFDNIRQNPFGHSTFSNMRILSTLGSTVISCGNLWCDNTLSSRVLSSANVFSINGTMDNLKVNSIGSITLLSSGNIFNDNTISSNAISCSNLWCNGTISSRTLSLTNLFSINGTMDNLKVNSIGSFGLISCGSLFTDNTLSSTAISTNNIFANNLTLGSLRINNHATIDNLLATNITITNAVPRITLRDTQASTDNEVVCRGYLKDLNSWMSGELGSNMMLSAGKLKADLQAVPFGGIQITDDKNIRIEAIKMTQWDGYNARISACETGVAASGALITFLNTTPIPNGLQVGAPQYFIYLNTFCIANAASATTALGVGSDALTKVDNILAGTEDLSIPTLNSININTTNFSASNISTSNVILNGTSLSTIITDTNISINNINSSIASLSNTAPSNFIATTLTNTNLLNTNITSNLIHVNNRINLSNTSQSLSTIPLFVEPNNDVNFMAISASGSGSFSAKRSGLIFGRQRTDLNGYRIEYNGSSNNLEFYYGSGNSVNMSHSTIGTNILNINQNRLSTGNILNTNTTTQNLIATNQTVLSNLIVNGSIGIGTSNSAGVSLNVNNPSGTCRVRASGPYSAQQGFGLFDTTNNTERWSIYREGNSDNLRIWNGSSVAFEMEPSGNLGLIGSLSCGKHLKIDGGTTSLPSQTNFHLYITGNEGSPNVGSLYVGDGTGWGFNFKQRTSSTDTIIGRINDNGDFWMSNTISCGNLRTSNLTTTNLQLNGSSLNTLLTDTFTSIDNLYLTSITGINLSNISTSNICSGTLMSTNLTTLNLAIANTAGDSIVRMNCSNVGGASNHFIFSALTEDRYSDLFFNTNGSVNFRQKGGGSYPSRFSINSSGVVSCGNLNTGLLTTTNQTVDNLIVNGNGATNIRLFNTFSQQSTIQFWDTTNSRGWDIYRAGNENSLRIWNGSSVVFDMASTGTLGLINVSCGNLLATNSISSGSVLSTNGIFTNFTSSNMAVEKVEIQNLNGYRLNSSGNILNNLSTQGNSYRLNPQYITKKLRTSNGNAVSAVSEWKTRRNPDDRAWTSVCWSSELGLFVAIAGVAGLRECMTSPDGINWTGLVVPGSNWSSICYSAELSLFVAVAYGGSLGDKALTSPDASSGSWTQRTTPTNRWSSVCWSPELLLFVAVSDSDSDRVMTSPDGINWTSRSCPSSSWLSVCWSSELLIFVAVALSGTNQVMTSPDGINWTARNSANSNNWISVCWSPELSLFVATAISGSGNRIMTSPDGITWTSRTSPEDNQWLSVCWSPELSLFVAVANSGTNRIMYSNNGINWRATPAPANNGWLSVCWSPELSMFCSVADSGTNNRIMTSKIGLPNSKSTILTSRVKSYNNGITTLGTGTSGVNTYTISYGETYTNASKLLIRLTICNNDNNNDTYSYNIREITTTNFTLNVYRVDSSGSAWANNLSCHWSVEELY